MSSMPFFEVLFILLGSLAFGVGIIVVALGSWNSLPDSLEESFEQQSRIEKEKLS